MYVTKQDVGGWAFGLQAQKHARMASFNTKDCCAKILSDEPVRSSEIAQPVVARNHLLTFSGSLRKTIDVMQQILCLAL